MKKILVIAVTLIIIVFCASLYLFKYASDSLPDSRITKLNNLEGEFYVFQNGNFIRAFKERELAIDFARTYSQTYVTKSGDEKWLWDNYPQFSVSLREGDYMFKTLTEALAFARTKAGAYVVNRSNKAVIWRYDDVLPESYRIEDVPLIAQNPELERGCEVTSLAMLLNYYGIGVSKMDLALQVEKDTTPYSKDKKGIVTFGDPSKGFVGDIYSKKNPGLGVYSGPIFNLLKQYIGTSAIDLTGVDFSDLYFFISKDKPVFVITNSTYKELPPDRFESWQTEDGPIVVTYSEHSVLVKGYDKEYIYFNDPLNGKESRYAPKEDFIKAWRQMGRQAVTYFE